MSSDRDQGPCAFCGAPSDSQILLVCGREVCAAIDVCKPDATAMREGSWWLTVKCMDRKRMVSPAVAGPFPSGSPGDSP